MSRGLAILSLLILMIIILLIPIDLNAQIHVRTSTTIEGSPVSFKPFTWINPDRPLIDETFYWRKSRNKDYSDKTSYNYHSVYMLDSIFGIRLYGIDFDVMNNMFEKKGPNKFRYWNKIRMGFSVMLERNLFKPLPEIEQYLDYINSEAFISFLHVPHAARGDQSTRARVGSYSFYTSMTSSRRINIYFKYYSFPSTWIKMYYNQERFSSGYMKTWFDIKRVGSAAEFEVTLNGYDKSVVHSSKDIYRGFTVIAGYEYNIDAKLSYLRLGFKMDFRNH